MIVTAPSETCKGSKSIVIRTCRHTYPVVNHFFKQDDLVPNSTQGVGVYGRITQNGGFAIKYPPINELILIASRERFDLLTPEGTLMELKRTEYFHKKLQHGDLVAWIPSSTLELDKETIGKVKEAASSGVETLFKEIKRLWGVDAAVVMYEHYQKK